MRVLKFLIGILLISMGLYALFEKYSTHTNFALNVVELTGLISGIVVLKRTIKNKPLLPDDLVTQRMLGVARQRWILGITAGLFYGLGLLVVELGTPRFLGYNRTSPTLSPCATILLAAIGSYFLWRYTRFIQLASLNSSQSIEIGRD